MSAPLIWFMLPLLVGFGLLLIRNDKSVSILAGSFSLILAVLAVIFPPDSPFVFLGIPFEISSTFTFFGRVFSLNAFDQTLLCYVYGFGSFWFFCTLAYEGTRKTVSISLAILGLLIGAISVEPFLYSAVLLQIAALIAIPTLVREGGRHGRGLIRFLINQTLGLPFILLAGFLLSGVEAGPDDLKIVLQAMLMLGLGFAFLLSVFPFYTWAPMLSEEIEPYKLAFLFLTFPLVTLMVGLDFIDKYSWLRNSNILFILLRNVGLILIVSASAWAAFQNHLGRIFAFSLVSSTGSFLIALSSPDHIIGLGSLFLLILPNFVTFGLWSYALTLLEEKTGSLWKEDLFGMAARTPFLAAGIAIANLTVAGLPLLAMYPVRFSIWKVLSTQSTGLSVLYGLSFLGYFIAATRSFSILASSPHFKTWKSEETKTQKITIILLIASILVLGLIPAVLSPNLDQIYGMFPNLAQLK